MRKNAQSMRLAVSFIRDHHDGEENEAQFRPQTLIAIKQEIVMSTSLSNELSKDLQYLLPVINKETKLVL